MLTPLIITNEELDAIAETVVSDETMPSKTYKIDFETGEIYAEFIDKLDAVKQAVIKTIKTTRDRYLIYSSDYGCEIQYLIGEFYSDEYLQIEVPRLIREALMIDDRINSVENFVVNRIGDELYVKFEVVTDFGDSIPIEVSL